MPSPIGPSDPAVHAAPQAAGSPHVPVMLAEVLEWLKPEAGDIIIDGTFGAGGYSRAILTAAPCQLIAFDRDPQAIAAGHDMVTEFAGRLRLVSGRFSAMAAELSRLGVGYVQGIVLDIGVSSMQLDQAARGFSFQQSGPLDMRMSDQGLSAAELVNKAPAELLAKIIFLLGDEPRSRAIAKAIVAQRAIEPITTTQQLVQVIEKAIGPQRPGMRIHPATKTFQALRIYINEELDELLQVLRAAELLLSPGGRLVVVSFHSLEDRIVKRFLAARSGKTPEFSRHMPGERQQPQPSFELAFKGHLQATEAELAANPRARSARMRAAIRTKAPAWAVDEAALGAEFGVPKLERMAH